MAWFPGGMPCLKKEGRDLLTLPHRHGNAPKGTLSGTPEWACLESRPLVEISRFVEDSSRSYAKLVIVGYRYLIRCYLMGGA